jgi:hypothetical protein
VKENICTLTFAALYCILIKLETIFLQDMLILAFFLLSKNAGDIAEAMCLIERLESECAFRSAVDIAGDHPALVSFIKGVWARKCPPIEEAHVIDVLPLSTSTTTVNDAGSPLPSTTAHISVQGYSMVAPSDSAEQESPPCLTSTTVDPSTASLANIIAEVDSGEESEDSAVEQTDAPPS